MRTLLGLVGVALALAVGSLAQAQNWQEVRPPGGGYRIEMPAAAQFDTQNIKLPDGRVAVMHQTVSEYADAAFLATYIDYPPDMIARGTPETHLNNAMAGTAKGHTLGSQRNIQLGGNPGRDYVIFRSDNLSMTVRNALVHNRLYQVVVVGHRGSEKSPDTRRFIESFAFVGQ